MIPQPVNPLISPRNKIAARVNLAIAAQVLELDAPTQREYLAHIMHEAKAHNDETKARSARAYKQALIDTHNARLAARNAYKATNRPSRRGKTQAQRKRRNKQ